MNGAFVTGTDTGVGKSLFAAALLLKMGEAGVRALVVPGSMSQSRAAPPCTGRPSDSPVAPGTATVVWVRSASGDRGWFVVHAQRGDWRLDVMVDGDGKIAGMLVRDHQSAPPVATSELELVLPVRGQWLVFWGGPTAEVNHHVDHASQRRAVDRAHGRPIVPGSHR